MKKLGFWTICTIPTVNILIMNVFQYIENTYTIGRTYNWWLDFILIIVILIFYIMHHVLSFATPLLLYKSKKEFGVGICLSAILSVLFANVIMLFEFGEPEWYGCFNDVPQHLMMTFYITMAIAIIVSILILVMLKRKKIS